ncbi:MAG: hypothetical protein QNJ90_02590 [Planctomycetota bacterium]|nr:hypothetical protein [Planctomycetota bacterium]
MSEVAQHEQKPDAGPEVRLAECWAEVTKALALYPDTNERVRAKLDELFDALHGVLLHGRSESGVDAERGVTLLFQDERIHVGSYEHTFEPSSTLAWLRERLDRSALAGVELMPDLDADAFVRFTRRLLDHYLRKDGERTFEALWPELMPGVVLIDRRFEGTFGGLAGMGSYAGGHGGSSGRGARHFITGLLTHPKVRRRLLAIKEEHAEEDGETEEASALLRELLEDVPADALLSRDALIDWVCARLEDLSSRLTGGGGQQANESERFAKLLHEVSERHFAREGPNLDRIKAGTHVETKPTGVRKRDEEIGDDLDSLVAEVQQLPSELAVRMGEDDEAAGPEQIAVVLHYAVHLQRPEELPGQQALLEKLLRNPGPRELDILREYVRWDGEADAESAARTTAVINVLERAGRTHLLRACGALSADFVVETFPDHFGRFLGALDLDVARDVAELDDVVQRVGGHELIDAAHRLMPVIEGISLEQAHNLLQKPQESRLPLARLLLQAHQKVVVSIVAQFLRDLEIPAPESFLLRTIRPYALLTPEYLMGLIDLHLGRVSAFALRTPISEVLCRHIAAVGDADPTDRSRLESIKLLLRYPSSRGEEMLKTLRRFGFGPFGGSEPPAVRKLARSLLKSWQAA